MRPITRIDLRTAAAGTNGDYRNVVLTEVNDHVVRLSTMTQNFHWHRHSNSDEVLMPVEGRLIVDFEDESFTLDVGEFVRVPQNVLHRTRPADGKVVTLSFEHAATVVTGG